MLYDNCGKYIEEIINKDAENRKLLHRTIIIDGMDSMSETVVFLLKENNIENIVLVDDEKRGARSGCRNHWPGRAKSDPGRQGNRPTWSYPCLPPSWNLPFGTRRLRRPKQSPSAAAVRGLAKTYAYTLSSRCSILCVCAQEAPWLAFSGEKAR